ncbi:MAG: glycosyltransferase family 2 protein [Janthinobacterium lividum]
MSLKIAIAIATAGRRDILSETIRFLANQSRPADELLICPAKEIDLDIACLDKFPSPSKVVSGPVGASAQRNVLINASTADVIVFFDDDFLPASNFLFEIERLFSSNNKIVIATGNVLADGAPGKGLNHDEGVMLLSTLKAATRSKTITPIFNGYGCNMAVRMSVVRSTGIRFDERLPRYSWLEDVDFSRQFASFGQIVKVDALEGVHLGTKKAGRSPGKSLGYSQIANRVYIMRKGNMSRKQAFEGSLRNIAANLVRSLNPEPWVDRRGRLHGNFLALWDWMRGRNDPEKILKF